MLGGYGLVSTTDTILLGSVFPKADITTSHESRVTASATVCVCVCSWCYINISSLEYSPVKYRIVIGDSEVTVGPSYKGVALPPLLTYQ